MVALISEYSYTLKLNLIYRSHTCQINLKKLCNLPYLTTQFHEKIEKYLLLRVTSTKFVQLMSHYLSRCISDCLTNRFASTNLENIIAHLYLSVVLCERRVLSCFFRGSRERLTSQREPIFENFSCGPDIRILRISITCPKNRAAAYPFLFPQTVDISIAYYARYFSLLHVSSIN